ncbi:hypothetical protein WICPIJ_006828 [Wickerhamomyces pijperi]|uniref:DASH complex subunit DAD2 n=1 Tax=Wickerhamomyces pijperi TaxID=599730 RepID=A0A9P8Q1N0_WICPI|nr:hypothetical protein WICPIJ_006828 [Wickerhamomyces pijperi]
MSDLPTLVSQKTKELQTLKAIKLLSDSLLDQLTSLETGLQTISDGTDAVALVIGNWDMIIKAVSLASMGLGKYQEEEFQSVFNEDEQDEKRIPLPELLVRLRVEERNLQEQAQQEGQVPDDEVFESDVFEEDP